MAARTRGQAAPSGDGPIQAPLNPRRRRKAGRLAFVLTASAILPSGSAGQEFRLGPHVLGVRVAVGLDPYEITGATAPQVMRQLETAGPRSVVRYSTLFTWSYEAEVLPRANGTPSDQCRFTDFEIVLDVTVTYPRWIPPAGVDPELVEAWEAYRDRIEEQWTVERDDWIARGEELVDRSRRHQDHCPLLTQRFHGTVREVLDRSRPLDGRPLTEPLGLRWPPETYDHLLDGPRADPALEASVDPAPGGIDDDAPQGRGETAGEEAPPSAPTVAVRPGRPRPTVAVPADLVVATETDLRIGSAAGFVAGLRHQGKLELLDVFGVDPETGAPVTIDTPVPIPGFTHVLLSTLAAALDRAGFLDLDVPLSAWLDDLSPRLGGATLRQLLEHRAGLDNAPPRDSTMAWSEVLDRLDDRALFTDPGTLPSYSMYSFALAARVIERTTGTTLDDALRRTILDPLGMAHTSFLPRSGDTVIDGLPVTYTSAADLLRFWYAWLDGTIGGFAVDELPDPDATTLLADGRVFRGGLWLDRPGGVPRLSLSCGSDSARTLVQVFPRTGTIVLAIGIDGWPRNTGTFLLDATGTTLRIGNEVFGPVQLSGIAGFARRARPCRTLSTSPEYVPVDFGPRAETGEWAGRYVNGDWLFALEDEGGVLVAPRGELAPWRIHRFSGDTYFASVPPDEASGVGFPFRLFRGPDGRRYVMLEDRAFLHEDDAPGR